MALDYDALLANPEPLLALWEKHHLTPRRGQFFTKHHEACLLGALAVDAGYPVSPSSMTPSAVFVALGLSANEGGSLAQGFDTGLAAVISSSAHRLGALVSQRLLGEQQ